jgi:tRNA threonylcarbamoyladenosine biosynthesis protein TsaE
MTSCDFMKEITFEYGGLEELKVVAKKILSSSDKKIFAFFGEMGAGKTTLIKSLCAELGVTGNISSPTFSIVNEYFSPINGKVFHFDFYRIKSEREAYDLGYEEYFYNANYCFIEWPEKIINLLPENSVHVKIVLKNNNREITISKI